MAHRVEQVAYVGQTSWHGLGNQLSTNQPIEVWQEQADMDCGTSKNHPSNS